MEPSRKRSRTGDDGKGATVRVRGQSSLSRRLEAERSQSSTSRLRTKTSKENLGLLSACDFILKVENYIPTGCLRVERSVIPADVWTSSYEWRWIAHPREIIAVNSGPFVENVLQEALFRQQHIQAYRNLHQAGWIRLQFKIRNAELGQLRVYILPEDIGRRMIDRADQTLRKNLQRLMEELDIGKLTWAAEWSQLDPMVHINTTLNDKSDDEESLFYIFNTLPSPTPNSSLVQDKFAKSSMEAILSGKVQGLKTNMMSYQRRSAAMMLQREAQPAQLVDPRLRRTVDQNGETWYYDITTGTCLRTPKIFEAARGGICAETMGLGKTLICLALILATREISSQIPPEYSVGTIPVRKRVGSLLEMSAATIGRTGTPWKEFFRRQERDGSDYSLCKDAIKAGAGYYFIPFPTPRRATRKPPSMPARKVWLSTTTIVVVPANLIRQWEREIEKHTTTLKVLVMNNNQTELPPAAEMIEYDIILFSRQRFEFEARSTGESDGRKESPNKSCDNSEGSGNQYRSPLRDVHFKRLITDEGHTIGNSKSATKTNAVIVVDFLQLSARWIISGTPTQGLYGAESIGDHKGVVNSDASASRYIVDNLIDPEQERKDLEKLGNIATIYLKSKPWANNRNDADAASWSQYVMQPRHGAKSHGNMQCLRNALEGMIIRHQQKDVEKDVELPPLYQKTVQIEGSLQDKLSLNMFSLMIVSNAVTSERRDADYLFHPRQRKPLAQLVANLRQASFFWAGITKADVEFTVEFAKKFLVRTDILITDEDRPLLHKMIEFGSLAIQNPIWLAASEHHEMPYFVNNDWASEVREAWSLDESCKNPTLIGSTQLITLQKYAQAGTENQGTKSNLVKVGRAAVLKAKVAATSSQSPTKRSKPKGQKKLTESAPTLAGGLRVAEDTTPKKIPLRLPVPSLPETRAAKKSEEVVGFSPFRNDFSKYSSQADRPNSTIEESSNSVSKLSPEFSNDSASILSTASSKLSYLIAQVLKYSPTEKIIIFYETDNVAFYLAQALEIFKVEHLIYAKSLSSERRSSYIVTFNQVETFRVLLMDISQAAFGLDVSSASRVYFINPVFNKQVEAQAVKRAHRIGQFRPVYVETLVLRDSIEEIIIERKKVMSSDEQMKCKSVLDDQNLYDWIKNVRFVPILMEDIPTPDQMALLDDPQPVFSYVKPVDGSIDGPDAGLLDFTTPKKQSKQRSFKTKDAEIDFDSDKDGAATPQTPTPASSGSEGNRRNGDIDDGLLGSDGSWADFSWSRYYEQMASHSRHIARVGIDFISRNGGSFARTALGVRERRAGSEQLPEDPSSFGNENSRSKERSRVGLRTGSRSDTIARQITSPNQVQYPGLDTLMGGLERAERSHDEEMETNESDSGSNTNARNFNIPSSRYSRPRPQRDSPVSSQGSLRRPVPASLKVMQSSHPNPKELPSFDWQYQSQNSFAGYDGPFSGIPGTEDSTCNDPFPYVGFSGQNVDFPCSQFPPSSYASQASLAPSSSSLEPASDFILSPDSSLDAVSLSVSRSTTGLSEPLFGPRIKKC